MYQHTLPPHHPRSRIPVVHSIMHPRSCIPYGATTYGDVVKFDTPADSPVAL